MDWIYKQIIKTGAYIGVGFDLNKYSMQKIYRDDKSPFTQFSTGIWKRNRKSTTSPCSIICYWTVTSVISQLMLFSQS